MYSGYSFSNNYYGSDYGSGYGSSYGSPKSSFTSTNAINFKSSGNTLYMTTDVLYTEGMKSYIRE